MRELKGDWRDLIKCFRIALCYRKMTFAFKALILTALGLTVIALVLGACYDKAGGKCAESLLSGNIKWAVEESYNWWQTNWPRYVCEWPTLVSIAVWLILVWSYFGLGITRVAAVEIAKDERIGLKEAKKFARKKYRDMLLTVVLLAVAFLFFFGCNWFFGGIWRWLDRICLWVGLTQAADTSVFMTVFAPLFVAIFLPLAILSGFIMVLILIGSIFSYHLFPAVLSAEGTDYFDAISRGFNYVFARPWHYIWYHLVTLVHGAISILFIGVFTCAMVNLGVFAGRLGLGPVFDQAWNAIVQGSPWPSGVIWSIATVIIFIWLFVVAAYALSYVFSYSYSATTMIYLLLRKNYDGVDMKEVYEEEEKKEEWKLPDSPPSPVQKKEEPPPSTTGEKKEEGAQPEVQK